MSAKPMPTEMRPPYLRPQSPQLTEDYAILKRMPLRTAKVMESEGALAAIPAKNAPLNRQEPIVTPRTRTPTTETKNVVPIKKLEAISRTELPYCLPRIPNHNILPIWRTIKAQCHTCAVKVCKTTSCDDWSLFCETIRKPICKSLQD